MSDQDRVAGVSDQDRVAGVGDRDRGARVSHQDRWYACYTRARHEKKVAARLRGRDITVYLPLVSRESQWHDRRTVVEWPMFPSYLFARCLREELYEVSSTPGVVTLVSFDGTPVPIPDAEIENIRRFAGALRETKSDPEPAPLVSEGQAVRVIEGPFRGIEGRVVERRKGRRVLLEVGLEAIGQGMKVEVPGEGLEILEEPAAESDPS